MLLNHINQGRQEDQNQLFISRKKAQRRDEAKHLMNELKRAVQLGNTFGETVEFHFKDKDGIPQKTEEIVQTVTAKYVIFRGGNMLPLERITRIIV